MKYSIPTANILFPMEDVKSFGYVLCKVINDYTYNIIKEKIL